MRELVRVIGVKMFCGCSMGGIVLGRDVFYGMIIGYATFFWVFLFLGWIISWTWNGNGPGEMGFLCMG